MHQFEFVGAAFGLFARLERGMANDRFIPISESHVLDSQGKKSFLFTNVAGLDATFSKGTDRWNIVKVPAPR